MDYRYLPRSLNKQNCLPIPLSRIELHIHLDGAIRYETIWELIKRKKLPLPGNRSLQDLKETLTVDQPKDLLNFLSRFKHFIPALVNDLEAIRRISLEFCEDQARNGVMYVEVRFCPHLLLSDNGKCNVTSRDIVKTVLDAFALGQVQCGIKVRLILSCIIGNPSWSWELLRLCEEFRDDGVVGIDVAGVEPADVPPGGQIFSPTVIDVFNEARKLGIFRTAHAGESGPAESVRQALNVLYVNRVGHGYHVLQDFELYKLCLERQLHFETCPTSSLLTNAVSINTLHHPIIQFGQDYANFSINSDDPTITGTHLNDEYNLVRSWGLTEAHLVRCNFNAARSSFLPTDEQNQLIKDLRLVYGIHD